METSPQSGAISALLRCYFRFQALPAPLENQTDLPIAGLRAGGRGVFAELEDAERVLSPSC
jgi:hypothetical protein